MSESIAHLPAEHARRVLLIETDERSGLVAAIAATCHKGGVSIEITTGLSHVLLAFEADSAVTQSTVAALSAVPGVSAVHAYAVMTALTA